MSLFLKETFMGLWAKKYDPWTVGCTCLVWMHHFGSFLPVHETLPILMLRNA